MSNIKYIKGGGIDPLWAAQEQQKHEDEHEILMCKQINEINEESKLSIIKNRYREAFKSYKDKMDLYVYGLQKQNEALEQELEIKLNFLMSHSNTKQELEMAKAVLDSYNEN